MATPALIAHGSRMFMHFATPTSESQHPGRRGLQAIRSSVCSNNIDLKDRNTLRNRLYSCP